jgi:uncharacterized protein YkwD
MARVWLALSCVSVLAVALAGCPLNAGSGLEQIPGTGVPGGSAGQSGDLATTSGDSGTTGGATAGTQAFNDQLTAQFPDCVELLSGEVWRDEILRLVNDERQQAGLTPLAHDQTLEDQATQYACELIHYDFFAHVNPVTGSELRDRAAEFGYDYYVIGENLAAGQATPIEAMTAWMGSARHRDNILNPDFTELGVGIRVGGRYGTYWVQEFGWPLETGPTVHRR